MRDIVIGDIHGCCTQLDALLERVSPQPGRDRLILLGDLFDRGRESWEVFQRVQELAETFGPRFLLLRGNHEDYLLQPGLTLSQRLAWNRVGRGATVRSFRAHGGRMEDAAPWLREMCRPYCRLERFQCVHAAVEQEELELNSPFTLLHDHQTVLRNQYAGRLTITGHIALPVPTWFRGDGETAEALPLGERLRLPERGVICIDTGCGKGGQLTALVGEDGFFRLESAVRQA